MKQYILHNKQTRLHSICINVISAAVREGDIFEGRGTIQNLFTKTTHCLIRSLEIKEHEYIQEIYNDILFEIQEQMAKTEGQAFMLDTAPRILIEGFNSTLEICLYNATLTFIYYAQTGQDEN